MAATTGAVAQDNIPSGSTVAVVGTTQYYFNGVNIDGALKISSAGQVYAYDYSAMGTVAGKSTLAVAGAGSIFELGYHDLNLGLVSGTTTNIAVTNGGTISLDSNFNAGDAAGSRSTIEVSGKGSSFSTGYQLAFGSAAGSSSDVTLSHGGIIHAYALQCCDPAGVIFIAPAGTANVKVTGAGSNLIADNAIFVGSNLSGGTGTGTLTVANGGAATSVGGKGGIVLAFQPGSSGTLNIGAPAGHAPVAPGQVAVAAIASGTGGRIVFNHTSDDYVFAPILVGAGSVSVKSGTTIFTGNSFYAGTTTIDGGELRVNSFVVGSPMIVNAGGRLSGYGLVQQATINAGGTFAPGDPATFATIGTVGDLTFHAGATYAIKVSPTDADRTLVGGTAKLGGADVALTLSPGLYAQTSRYTILSANSVSGRFVLANDLAFLRPVLSYDAYSVYLTVDKLAYATAAATQNQRQIGGALDNAIGTNPTGTAARFATALSTLSLTQARAAFDALSGEGITATQNLANRSTQMFNDAIFDQTAFYGAGAGNQITLTTPQPGFLALAPSTDGPPVHELADLPTSRPAVIPDAPATPARTWRAWASGFGGAETIHGDASVGSARQDNTIYGGTVGVDYQLMPNYLLGVAVGGSDGDFNVPGRATSGSTSGGHVAFYDLATFGAFYGASSSSFSYFTNRTTRFVGGFGGLGNETERGSFDSHEFRSRLEFGRHLDTSAGTLTPFVALEIAELRSNGFAETAVSGPGLFRLAVSGQSAADAPGSIGVRFQNVMPVGGMTFLPTLQLAYVHEFAPYRSQIGTLADLPGATFLVDGAAPARNAAQVKAGGEMRIGANAAIFANFDGEFSGINQLYAGKGGFRWLW